MSLCYCSCLLLSTRKLNDTSSVRVKGSTNPALEDITLTFLCPPGLTLGNGEWEPDPREAVGIGKSLVYGHVSALYMHDNIISHIAHIISIAPVPNCDRPPSPPTNGHILPYTNTLEGATVTYLC